MYANTKSGHEKSTIRPRPDQESGLETREGA